MVVEAVVAVVAVASKGGAGLKPDLLIATGLELRDAVTTFLLRMSRSTKVRSSGSSTAQ